VKDALKKPGEGREFVVEDVKFNRGYSRPFLHKSCSAKMNTVGREKRPAMRTRYIVDLRRAGARSSRGDKGGNALAAFITYGVPVPPGFCCTFDAWRSYRERGPRFSFCPQNRTLPLDRSFRLLRRPLFRRRGRSFGELFCRSSLPTLLDVRGRGRHSPCHPGSLGVRCIRSLC